MSAFAPVVVGSGGRAHVPRTPRALPTAGGSDCNSFCLLCASWYFGQNCARCEKCGAAIFRWVTNGDLRFFRTRSLMSGF